MNARLSIALAAATALLAPSAALAAHGRAASWSSPVAPAAPHALTPAAATPGPAIVTPGGALVVDPVVSNTDPSLTNTDTAPDSEPTVAVDPSDPSRVVITAFSGCWKFCGTGHLAPLWTSLDGGATWTKSFSLPRPTRQGTKFGCPCDQQVAFDRSGTLFGTFLEVANHGGVFTGSTTDPTSAAAWTWPLDDTGRAIDTSPTIFPDQPQIAIGPDPAAPAQDTTYVAYDNFSTYPIEMHVAASSGSAPPIFTSNVSIGLSATCPSFPEACVNPGLRIATSPIDGTVWAIWQSSVVAGPAGSMHVDLRLDRSTDGGRTWSLRGSPDGVALLTIDNYQGLNYKLGGVNASIGGVHSLAVDPRSGALYLVYGVRDPAISGNGLRLVRITDDGAGGITMSAPRVVPTPGPTSLPALAVSSNGTVGILSTSLIGAVGELPEFETHIVTTGDRGRTFGDELLVRFFSDEPDNGNARQRIFGDYQVLRAVDRTFYGTFTSNGDAFGRPFANMDPTFVRFRPPNGG
jgi:hypothetical protein